MQLSNKKTFSVILFITAGIFISIAATKPVSPKIKTERTFADTGFFKNLQVLPKDISKDSLGKVMDNFKTALGVKCGFCHAADSTTHKLNFASDEKEEKGIARYMMKMTVGINSTYFNFEKSAKPDTITVVGCITCHHGNPHPGETANAQNEEHHDMPPPHDSTGKMLAHQ